MYIDILCPEARCNCSMAYDFDKKRHVVQHGDNMEALFFINDEDLISNTVDQLKSKYYSWVKTVHEYLDEAGNYERAIE